MKRDLKPIITELRTNLKYQRLKESVATLPIFRLPHAEHEKELLRIHKTREVRILSPQSPKFMEAFLSASIRDMAQRSRVSEIRMETGRCLKTLKVAVDALRDYLYVSYSQRLSFVRTKEERMMVLDIILRPFLDRMADCERVLDMCDIITADIDKAGFALKTAAEVVKVHKFGGVGHNYD